MGLLAAQCMSGVEEDYALKYHVFDLFVHVSHFFDYKVQYTRSSVRVHSHCVGIFMYVYIYIAILCIAWWLFR